MCQCVFNKIQFDWFVKVGETDYGCHGALECNEKDPGNWHWNNVTWPELYIAHPYYDTAITGFFICQPLNEAICVSQATALTPWTWWTNDYQECRLDPTKVEACLELPNLHYNDIIESFWNYGECWVVRQETEGAELLEVKKRGMSGWGPLPSTTDDPVQDYLDANNALQR
jgi:hypothetical protein